MKSEFTFPDWVPQVSRGSKILLVGASGGIGQAVIRLLFKGPSCVIGAHRASSKPIQQQSDNKHTVIDLHSSLRNGEDCNNLVNDFKNRAGGIDALVVLCGGVLKNIHWRNLTEKEWKHDIDLNLNIPFFLSRAAMKWIKNSGSIILMGTESALHGGSPTSFPYSVAKKGIECLVQGLAREGAKSSILVNGIRAGFIRSGFHERWQGKTSLELEERKELIPLKRAGEPEEIAALIIYLLSGWSKFITGQMFAITGGDWL